MNARIHAFAGTVVCIAGFSFGITATEWCLVVFAMGIVLAAEAFNTSLESLVDLVSPEYHILAKHAKDTAAAAVMLSSIAAAIVGFIIFIPHFYTLLMHILDK